MLVIILKSIKQPHLGGSFSLVEIGFVFCFLFVGLFFETSVCLYSSLLSFMAVFNLIPALMTCFEDQSSTSQESEPLHFIPECLQPPQKTPL